MRYLVLLLVLLLPACNGLGGIQPDLATSAKNAGVSCIRVKSLVMGDAVSVMVNDTKNAIANGSITVNPDSCAITINNAPGTTVIAPVTSTTTGTSTQTTVIAPVK